MNIERPNGGGAGYGFNPDAPTEESDSRGRMPDERREDYAQVSGFSPDMPTIDGDTKTYIPESRKNKEKPRRVTVTPDAPTLDDDGDQYTPAAPRFGATSPASAKAPEKPAIGSVPFVPMGQKGNGGPAAGAAPAPFKPMDPGSMTGRPFQGSRAAGQGMNPPANPGRPAQGNYENNPPRREPAYTQPPVSQPVIQSRPPAVSVNTGRETKIQPDQRSLTLREMTTVAERQYSLEVQQYTENLERWKKKLWIPIVLTVSVAVMALLGGAFAGIVGVAFVLLLAAASIAILAATGKLRGMVKPRKPQKKLPEMETPELTSVYTVKLRLKSTNLPKPVEITIRKEEQLLGCDKDLCIQPLPYKGVSHRHCTIISKHQHGHTTYFLRDEGSKNGTRLNDRKLDPGIDYPLQIGDLITLAGRYQFKVLSDAY